MRKQFIICALMLLFASGCSTNKSSETVDSKKETTETSTSNEVVKSSRITAIGESGEIKKDGETKYVLTVKEVKDVTEEAKNKTVNDSNFLDFYSNSQAKQAVEIVLTMKNISGETLGLPYFDDIKVKDSDGITNVGGWKNEGSTTTEFGNYQTEGMGGDLKPGLYEIENNETKIVSSTVLLATTSDEISFTVNSDKFNDKIDFVLPIEK